ncbi:MAG TPA: FAD-dependent thymidylate synthase [Dehalococcoidia bacterium]|nr:FAD-dependent thymidylate synthase [Dehalococcoidia bacterium]
MTPAAPEPCTPEERDILARYFTDVDGDVFALVSLPDVVKGALFSRYSRSPKSLRRLFLDEFYDPSLDAGSANAVGLQRAEEFYERVLVEYGDDSVAQLVGAHVAVENASNVLTKVLEWGRLMSYLEQSTRYIPYNDRPNGRWRYHTPAELHASPLRQRFEAAMDLCFETYSRWFEPVQEMLRERFPKDPRDTKFVYRQSIRAKACDILRGLLPAATTANVGLFGSAQAFEALLLRLQAHPIAEARAAGDAILRELRKVIPVFMRRIDQPERGLAWSGYVRDTAADTRALADSLDLRPATLSDGPSVRLTDFDPDGETKVIAAALYPHARAGDASLLDAVRAMPPDTRERVMRAYVGERTNRRHRPGRAFERTSYRFDVVSDYGAFRDLQRHRMLTLDWQPLSPSLGYETPDEVRDVGATADWDAVMAATASLYQAITDAGMEEVAPYAVPMAYRIRYYMQMNAREAMHLIELRTSLQGHPAYRWVGREMLRLIDEQAGHHAIAGAMRFVGADDRAPGLERLAAERASEAKRNAVGAGG